MVVGFALKHVVISLFKVSSSNASVVGVLAKHEMLLGVLCVLIN